MVCLALLPAMMFVVRVNLRLITHHAGFWARTRSLRGAEQRSAMLFNDEHVRLGDPVLSGRIWQARYVGLMSIVAVVTLLGATNPRCVALWI